MRTDVWQRIERGLADGVQPDGESYAAPLAGGHVLLPLRRLEPGRRVASLIVNQAGFGVLDALTDALARALAPHGIERVVGLPTLGLPVAEGVARRLGHDRLVPLGISRKVWYDAALSVPLASSTTPGGGKRLYLDPRTRPLLTGRIALVDDVASSGASLAAALDLLALAGVRPVVLGVAMAQGAGWRARVDLPLEAALRTPILEDP